MKRPAVPADRRCDRVRTPVDAFVLAKLREKELDFAPEADKRDADPTRDARPHRPACRRRRKSRPSSPTPRRTPTKRLVDRLLASPPYGERWARHWLDVVGYADSNGYTEADSPRPHAWRYRDYVIRAFNEDKPWSDFIREQLAGDELAGVTHAETEQAVLDPKRRDELIATGFLRMAPDGTGDAPDDPKLARNQVIAEEMKIVSSSLLGLTVACAQCHDHRYDPITQADYYRLRAIFDPAYDWQNWRAPVAAALSRSTRRRSARRPTRSRSRRANIEAAARR